MAETFFDASGSHAAAVEHIEKNFDLSQLTSVKVNSAKKTATFYFANATCTIKDGFSLGATTSADALQKLLLRAGFQLLYAQEVKNKNQIALHVHRGNWF